MWQEPAGPFHLDSSSNRPAAWPETSPGGASDDPLALTHVWEIAMGAGFWRGNSQVGEMSLRAEQRDGSAWLLLAGELDYASVSLIEECLAAMQTRNDSVILDLQDVTFMDSSGIDILVHASRRADNKGGWVLVVNSHKHRRIFTLCDADCLLDSFDHKPLSA